MAWFSIAYALFAYVVFLATTLWAVAFLGDWPLLTASINRGPASPPGEALAVNLGLFLLFGLQHSVMARQRFKRWWTRWVPAPVERATYVLAASLCLALLLWQWRPMPSPVLWSVETPAGRLALQALGWAGWILLGLSSWLLDHFALFGLRQPWVARQGRPMPDAPFRTPLLYRHVRHPIYLGFLVAFWATPDMTAGHALFAAASTAYILVGVAFEERDLLREFGPRYRDYQSRVGMLLPRWPWPRNGR